MKVPYPPFRLSKKLARFVERGGKWIYGRYLDRDAVRAIPPGSLVQLVEEKSLRFVGIGYVNPYSRITIRVLDTRPVRIQTQWFRTKLQSAWNLRERYAHTLWPETDSFRLVNGEGDGLPGVIVDWYNGKIVFQLLTAGAERFRPMLLEAFETLMPQAVLEKSAGKNRQHEGLNDIITIHKGKVDNVFEMKEFGLTFPVFWKEGHKTGFYLDQKDNRYWLSRIVSGKKFLDVCAFTGAFSRIAHACEAKRIVAIEKSETIIQRAQEWFRSNGIHTIEWIAGDMFDVLRELGKTKERFDVIVLDPPPLVSSRRHQKAGVRAYRELLRQALYLLVPEGILLVCSCSHFMSESLFIDVIHQAAGSRGLTLQVLEYGQHPPDHPYALAQRETKYFQWFRVRRM